MSFCLFLCLSANAPPTLLIGLKMASVIDKHVYRYGKHAKKYQLSVKSMFLNRLQNLKSMLKKLLSSTCFRTDSGFRELGLCRRPRMTCISPVLNKFKVLRFVFVKADM